MMISDEQKRLAKDFLDLHYEDTPFILPGAWDVLSAKMFEVQGFSAIGTTSAVIACSLGFPDGERISFQETHELLDHGNYDSLNQSSISYSDINNWLGG